MNSYLCRTRCGAALVLAILSASLSSAQTFIGTDDFNDNTLTLQSFSPTTGPQLPGQWRFSNPNASRPAGTTNAWTETNQRMEFTTDATAGFSRGFLGWISPFASINEVGGAGLATGAPFTSSWTAQVQVTNNPNFLTNGFSNTGFEIYSTASPGNVSNTYYAIGLNVTPSARWIVVEWGRWDTGTAAWVIQNAFIATDVTTDVRLRMSYDGTSKTLVTDYSNDGGINYLTGATYALTGAHAGNEAPYNDGFGLEFYASTVDVGSAITSGQMYFDNLAVSAIPEPATFAMLIGLMALGFAGSRRRSAAA